jgi:hypothetical protein
VQDNFTTTDPQEFISARLGTKTKTGDQRVHIGDVKKQMNYDKTLKKKERCFATLKDLQGKITRMLMSS